MTLAIFNEFERCIFFLKCPLSAKEAVRVEREDLSKYDSNYDLFLMKSLFTNGWIPCVVPLRSTPTTCPCFK